jgi:hypothetical protein
VSDRLLDVLAGYEINATRTFGGARARVPALVPSAA